MTPVLVPCSRNAHDQNVLVRRPQWDQHGCHSMREKRASLEGSLYGWWSLYARSGGQSRPPPKDGGGKVEERDSNCRTRQSQSQASGCPSRFASVRFRDEPS
jgi:hypothetical protein